MRLNCLVQNFLWHATQPLKFGPIPLSSRMTVVRLQDGRLWVHSPISPTRDLVDELQAIGPVGYVIAPNRFHHLFFAEFLAAHPSAQGYVAPGLHSKRPDLKHYPTLPAAAPWSDELDAVFIDGLPLVNETVWFHPASGTLIVTDLLFCFSEDKSGFVRFVAKLLGVYGNLGMSRTEKLCIKDKAAFRASVARLLSMPVQRIVLAHDQVIEEKCSERLVKAFAWLQQG
jgi:Domain of unknown function (DUF4336)